jgi:RNA polymerase sigma-70 factor (ECF subfamily)
MPQIYREVVQRRYLLEMTSEQIGEELGVPAATVRSRLHLAIIWLRSHRAVQAITTTATPVQAGARE